MRFADLDARGHLNNVAFLQFFEAARIAYLRSLNPDHDPTAPSREDVIVARTEIDYLAPARFEEEIHTTVRPAEVDEKKLTLELEMLSAEDGRVLARGSNVVVGYDYDSEESAPLAEPVRRALRASPPA